MNKKSCTGGGIKFISSHLAAFLFVASLFFCYRILVIKETKPPAIRKFDRKAVRNYIAGMEHEIKFACLAFFIKFSF